MCARFSASEIIERRCVCRLWFDLMPGGVVEVDFQAEAAAAVDHEAGGDFDQEGPLVAEVVVTIAGLPGALEDFLKEVVGYVVAAGRAEQVSAHGQGMIAHPVGEAVVRSDCRIVRGHVYL